MNEFVSTVLKYSKINENYLIILPTHQYIPSINCGLIFVFATWSGSAISSFMILTETVSKISTLDIKIYVFNADSFSYDFLASSGSDSFRGWGETYWIKDNIILNSLSKYNGDDKLKIISYTNNLNKLCKK